MPPDRTDLVLPETRGASWVIVAILIPALVILWGFPSQTADLWAWSIKPDMTPIFMGSGYGAGVYFFWHVARGRQWHPASAGVLGAAVFAALMLVATLVHWDRFNHGHAPFVGAAVFYGWVAVYILSPFAVGALWWRNQRLDPRRPVAGDPVVGIGVRRVAAVIGAVAIAAGLFFLLSPQTAVDHWPWTLTPLTARVLGCFTAQVGLGAVLLARDERWTSWRLLLETFFVAVALLLTGAARAWSDFEGGGAATWVFIGGLAGLTLAAGALYRRMQPARRGNVTTADPQPVR